MNRLKYALLAALLVGFFGLFFGKIILDESWANSAFLAALGAMVIVLTSTLPWVRSDRHKTQ